MTLRWRLTLFYTALLALLLTSVGVTTLYLMRSSLIGGLDNELRGTYTQFTTYVQSTRVANELSLPLDAARNDPGQVSDSLMLARYQFPNSSLALEQIDVYDRQTLLDSLNRARTPEERAALLSTLEALRNASRRSLGVDTQQPISLSGDELAALIRSSSGQLFLNHLVHEPYRAAPTLMRLMVVLTPLPQVPAGSDGVGSVFGPNDGLSIVYVARSLSTVQDTLSKLQNVILLLFVVGLITAGSGAYVLAGQALQPLRRVQRAAERIGGQTLTERVPVPQTGDEVESLAMALNAMLGRLEDSFDAQRRFTSDASHELRTPVTAISGHAGYLLRRTNPTEQQQESLKIIQSESARLTNLIASLLQLARSDSGALLLSREPIFATLLLSDIARELAPLAQAQHTTLSAAGQEVAFEGDPDRLKQVIINLVSNALKAGAQTITLDSHAANSAAVGGPAVRLSVHDDGPGIPADQLERLFDRFYRLEDSRSRDQGGAGLGLSIARGIVDAHGGRIWLESEVGRGTTAHVELPIGNVPVLDEDDVP
ncbi:sensor histidine kinase [Deinococcus knuensis]|uniref:histidine kinase n=1 Tax=Deinococcus knuensis TaxID=1837380 RepID=A0ABQ2SR46_9DEIO|nr:HAMP domain-containing sensor histidine kinase [Deinococcus knuensis]GGS35276.1 two-component sensor histidine kinase [Deinococcus knuensis]